MSITYIHKQTTQNHQYMSQEAIQERQKLIRIADRSDYGWDVVQEYISDELAADSDDEKKLLKAEKVAEQKSQKKRAAAPKSSGGSKSSAAPSANEK